MKMYDLGDLEKVISPYLLPYLPEDWIGTLEDIIGMDSIPEEEKIKFVELSGEQRTITPGESGQRCPDCGESLHG